MWPAEDLQFAHCSHRHQFLMKTQQKHQSTLKLIHTQL